jgi:carboxyvinyl-carboxyphosphonate phosphorylmutase
MSASERRHAFRAILDGATCVHPASVFDPLSAPIAGDLGFEAMMFAGSVASLAVLGAPDLILLSLAELADQTRRICKASPLPLIVDADHGYGNALNAKRTAEELADAGAAAVTIEDTVLPATFGTAGTKLVSLDEGVGKIGAAVAGAKPSGLVVIARTDLNAAGGLAPVIERVQAYAKTGADAVFVTNVTTLAELDTISKACVMPLMCSAMGELGDKETLARHRVRICLQGHQPFYNAVRAVHDTLSALRNGVPPAELADPRANDVLRRASREIDYKAWQQEYLASPPGSNKS